MRASYHHAIQWMADNDDTEWVNSDDDDPIMSVTACMVADLFVKTDATVVHDLRKILSKKIGGRIK